MCMLYSIYTSPNPYKSLYSLDGNVLSLMEMPMNAQVAVWCYGALIRVSFLLSPTVFQEVVDQSLIVVSVEAVATRSPAGL